MEIVGAWSSNYEKLFSIEQEVKCKTIKYTTTIGTIGTGITIPKQITQQFGIRMNHYIEALLKKVIKDEETVDIFPERKVFEHYPIGFEHRKI